MEIRVNGCTKHVGHYATAVEAGRTHQEKKFRVHAGYVPSVH